MSHLSPCISQKKGMEELRHTYHNTRHSGRSERMRAEWPESVAPLANFWLSKSIHNGFLFALTFANQRTDSRQLRDFPENPLAGMTGMGREAARSLLPLCSVHLRLVSCDLYLATAHLLAPAYLLW